MKSLQRILLITGFVTIMACVCLGCGKEDGGSPQNSSLGQQGETSQEQIANGYIGSMALTSEQQDLINLLGVNQDFYIFSYSLDEQIQRVSVWVEEYENGVINQSGMESSSAVLDNRTGKICLHIDDSSLTDWHWQMTMQDASGYSRWSGDTNYPFLADRSFTKGVSVLSTEQEQIFAGQEIALMVISFTKGDMSIYDTQYLIENPEILQEYDYAIVVKCRFDGSLAE